LGPDFTGNILMAGVYAELRDFALAHRRCGDLWSDVGPLERDGYLLAVACSCGARLERWITSADAEEDLLRSTMLAFEN
jgi:hypothetical protein